MASIRLKIEGDQGAIGVEAFLTALDALREMLTDLAKSVSPAEAPFLDWAVTDLQMGSLQVELTPVKTWKPDKDISIAAEDIVAFGERIIGLEIDGLDSIESEIGTPLQYLSSQSLTFARKISNVIDTSGATGIVIRNGSKQVLVTQATADKATAYLKESRVSFGSVEGVLDRINIHKTPNCTIYSSLTKKAISCTFVRASHQKMVAEALGRRVSVNGRVHSNRRGDVLRIEMESLRILRDSPEIPDILNFAGSEPDYSGGLSSEDYVGVSRRD